jgi:Proteasome subunit
MPPILHNRSSIVKRNPCPLKHNVLHSLSRFQPDFGRLLRKQLMTVCIAAITSDTPAKSHIVTASDTLISFGRYNSADATSVKMESFYGSWHAMMAAEDVSQCIPIIARATENLQGEPETLSAVSRAFKKAYKEHLSEIAADQVLSHFDMGMAEFKKNGSKLFTPEIFNSLSQEIRNVTLECSFLVYGFDEKNWPHIFAVDPPGRISVHDKPGFWAIGSGSFAALSMLFSLHQSVDRGFFDTIFNVLAAKFMAESPGSVGEHTFFYIHEKDCDWFKHPVGVVETMREWWNNKGKPKLDPEVLKHFHRQDFTFYSTKKLKKELASSNAPARPSLRSRGASRD